MGRMIRTYVPTKAVAAALIGVTASLVSAPSYAHPSYAMFDLTVELVITGVVDRFDYTVPHSWLHISVVDTDGTERPWALEMDGVPALYQNGIMADFVEPGEVVTVRINPLRGGRPGGLWRGSVDAQGNTYGEAKGLDVPVR